MDFLDFTADENDAGRRIDKIVRRLMPDHSLGMIYKYFRKGLVRKNKGKTSPESKIVAGDIINIAEFLLNSDSNSSSAQPQKELNCFLTILCISRYFSSISLMNLDKGLR